MSLHRLWRHIFQGAAKCLSYPATKLLNRSLKRRHKTIFLLTKWKKDTVTYEYLWFLLCLFELSLISVLHVSDSFGCFCLGVWEWLLAMGTLKVLGTMDIWAIHLQPNCSIDLWNEGMKQSFCWQNEIKTQGLPFGSCCVCELSLISVLHVSDIFGWFCLGLWEWPLAMGTLKVLGTMDIWAIHLHLILHQSWPPANLLEKRKIMLML